MLNVLTRLIAQMPCHASGSGPPDHLLESSDVSVDTATTGTTTTGTTATTFPTPSFAELGMPPVIVKALARAKITTPTPVQAAVLPDALAGRDVLGRAVTGSGKTLAFGLPILTRLTSGRSKPKSPRALIVVPTRELAAQVRSALEPLADSMGMRVATVYGGTPYDRQIKRLRAGVDVVVATPGRLHDLVNRGACRLDRIEITVLDEADHLCDLGFFPAVSEIVSMTPEGGQRMLLSATLDGDVDRLVRNHLHSPVAHDCDPDSDTLDIDHHVLVTGPQNKLESAAALLRANPRSIVFTRTRHGATNLAEDLAELGVTTVDLHGSLSQNARERNLRKFRTGQADVVVATDVAARGIHVDGVNLVVHYDAPTEHKAYLHRSGRTARAGNSGTVVTLTTSRQVSTVVRLQKAAGVTALHHDARTAPQPMTAKSLAASGMTAGEAGLDDSRKSGDRAYSGSRHKTSARQSRVSRSRSRPASSVRDERLSDDRLASRANERPRRRKDGSASQPVDRTSLSHPVPYRPSQSQEDRPPRDNRLSSLPRGDSRADSRPTQAPARRQLVARSKRTPKPGAGSGLKKARWTGAEKRAKAKR